MTTQAAGISLQGLHAPPLKRELPGPAPAGGRLFQQHHMRPWATVSTVGWQAGAAFFRD